MERYEQNGNISSHSHAWSAITGKPSTFTPSDHSHDGRYYTETEVNNLLAGKASSSHAHAWSAITGKPSTFPPSTHTHAWNLVGNFTGNKTLNIPNYNNAQEFMIAWRYGNSLPWRYTVYIKNDGYVADSYYYSDRYFGCMASQIASSVLKMISDWCTCKNNADTYDVNNIQVFLYYR